MEIEATKAAPGKHYSRMVSLQTFTATPTYQFSTKSLGTRQGIDGARRTGLLSVLMSIVSVEDSSEDVQNSEPGVLRKSIHLGRRANSEYNFLEVISSSWVDGGNDVVETMLPQERNLPPSTIGARHLQRETAEPLHNLGLKLLILEIIAIDQSNHIIILSDISQLQNPSKWQRKCSLRVSRCSNNLKPPPMINHMH